MKTKFEVLVQEVGGGEFTETFTQEISPDEVGEWISETMKNFNRTLKPGEKERVAAGYKILETIEEDVVDELTDEQLETLAEEIEGLDVNPAAKAAAIFSIDEDRLCSDEVETQLEGIGMVRCILCEEFHWEDDMRTDKDGDLWCDDCFENG